MTNQSLSPYKAIEIIPTSAYSYTRDSDGCDETFDIICLATQSVVASIHFWDEAERVEANARRLISALNAIEDISPNFRVHALFAKRRQVAVIWDIEDVQGIRPDLDADQSWQVLQQCRRVHDCSVGFNWDLIKYVADDMIPATNAAEGSVP